MSAASAIPVQNGPPTGIKPAANTHKATRSLPTPGYYTGLGGRPGSLTKLSVPGSARARRPISSITPAGHGKRARSETAGATAGGAPGASLPLVAYGRKEDVGKDGAAEVGEPYTPNWKLQEELKDEKQRLHDQSVAMVAQWHNTIAGQRRRRLYAHKERERMAEIQRQEMDKDWEAVKAAERQALVDRAKNMQYLEDVRVRQLKSQALITQVLKSARRQLEYKSVEQALIQSARKTSWPPNSRVSPRPTRKQPRCSARSRRSCMRRRRRTCKCREARRAEQEREKAQLREWFAAQSEKALEDARELEERELLRKQQQTKELVTMLDWAIQDKQERENEADGDEAELDRINEHIMRIKERIALKRKETEAALIRSRVLRNEYVATKAAPIQDQFRKTRDEFLHKMEHAHEGELEHRLRAEADQRKRTMQACVEAMQRSVEDRRRQQVLEKFEDAEVRKQSEELARNAARSADRRKDRTKTIQAVFGNDYRREISEHVSANARVKAAHKQEYSQAVEKQLQEDRQFHQFAMKLCKDLRSIGNDPAPVEKRLAEMDLDPRARQPVASERTSDTFHRLGFQ
ncbi:hypothetical protein AMAG_11205 [Allomyces macrogynus ATCC 38327]|uniref:Trichohyalin-plectin-homology domain-containing protein n=1 Tax=Allomyces macrogynus (strain ATCC 38327) TaxID=578462 RepID=A0A0L0SW57_ALLM3|nr:hypothetical protein AMAG_11205 [Allomyces macrogynus ATCC 38327]|eukprot:KNE66706.1 hypothetical protein AMAG_11205 [Allomyces macrogynus ATCC 38327]